MLLLLPFILFYHSFKFYRYSYPIKIQISFTKLNNNCTATLLTKKHNLQGNAFVGVKTSFLTNVPFLLLQMTAEPIKPVYMLQPTKVIQPGG